MEISLHPTKNICNKSIVFISDLHFDYIQLTSDKNSYIHSTYYSYDNETAFINFIKDYFFNDILCLGGDYYDNPYKTIQFVKRLEASKIHGFFVLGNHDYWNNGTLSHEDIIAMYKNNLSTHIYFRFLSTGEKYFIDDLCFIGDTGWTSFKRTVCRYAKNEHERTVTLRQFMTLPDAKYVQNFLPKKIQSFHNEWIEFANHVLANEQKVIVLTHYPMIDLTNEDFDCWWSSCTKILNTENQWRFFGHTHKRDYASYCNLSKQRGFANKILKENTPELYNEIQTNLINRKNDSYTNFRKHTYISPFSATEIDESKIQNELEKAINQYTADDFGVLRKASDRKYLSVPFQHTFNKFYNASLALNPNEISLYSNSVKRSGYKRSSANKINFAQLANNKTEYLKKVRAEIETAANVGNIRIGYYYIYFLKQETIEALNSAADYLEQNEIFTDVRSFITAAIITGYAWNNSLSSVENMRPVNDYDIARFFMQFLTMQNFNIGFDQIVSVQRSKKDKIAFGNIELWLPQINGKQLEIKDVMLAFSSTPLIKYINPSGLKYKIICQSCGHEWELTKKQKILHCKYCTPKKLTSNCCPQQAKLNKEQKHDFYLKRFQNKLESITPNIEAIDYISGEKGTATLKCKQCNHIWTQRSDHFYRRPYCPKCKNSQDNNTPVKS